MSSILDRFELASIKRMIKNAKVVSSRSNNSFLYIFFDMAKCILKDGIGYMEYNLFHFENKSEELRKTYVTLNYSNYLCKRFNESAYLDTFNNKLEFNKIFKDLLGRDYLDIENSSFDEFKKYCKGKDKIFAKPKDSCSGIGIYKSIELNENTILKDLFEYLKDNKLYVEDYIVQHPTMNKLNPTSINTIRITTLLDDKGEPHIMYALQRMGINNMTVDNIGSGGIYTVLNEDGEIVCPCWSDKTISTYKTHPTTGFELIGFKVPYFKKALKLCEKAAKVQNHIRYIGFDIAITKDGPVIVEGNPLPGYDMPQNYFVTQKDTGLKPAFERIIND